MSLLNWQSKKQQPFTRLLDKRTHFLSLEILSVAGTPPHPSPQKPLWSMHVLLGQQTGPSVNEMLWLRQVSRWLPQMTTTSDSARMYTEPARSTIELVLLGVVGFQLKTLLLSSGMSSKEIFSRTEKSCLIGKWWYLLGALENPPYFY